MLQLKLWMMTVNNLYIYSNSDSVNVLFDTFFCSLYSDLLLIYINSSYSLAVVSINFDPIVYNVTEGMSATLGLVLSTTSTEDVTVDLTTVDGSASG